MLEKKDQLKVVKKKRIITHPMQEVAVDILEELLVLLMVPGEMIKSEDLDKLYDKYFKKYALCEDPFTNMPCTTKEWAKNSLEYQRQIMDEKYGHHDGLE